MAEEIYGPAFEIHGGGLDLVFPHHENEVAQSRALGHPFASIWAHNGMLEFTGDEDVEVGRQRDDDPRGDRRLGPRGDPRLLPHRVVAQADRLLGRDDGAGGCPPRHAAERVHARGGAGGRGTLGTRSSQRSKTTSTRRPRSPSCTSGRRRGSSSLLRARARGVRARLARGARRGAAGGRRARRAPVTRARRARLRDVGPAAGRARRARLADARRAGGGYTLVPL